MNLLKSAAITIVVAIATVAHTEIRTEVVKLK